MKQSVRIGQMGDLSDLAAWSPPLWFTEISREELVLWFSDLRRQTGQTGFELMGRQQYHYTGTNAVLHSGLYLIGGT